MIKEYQSPYADNHDRISIIFRVTMLEFLRSNLSTLDPIKKNLSTLE